MEATPHTYNSVHRSASGTNRQAQAIPSKVKGYLLLTSGVLVLTPDALLIRSVSEDIDIFSLLFFRCGLYGISVLVFMLLNPGLRRHIVLSDKWCNAAGIMWGLAGICFTMSIRNTAAANTLVILAANPMFAVVLSCIFLREEVVPLRTYVAIIVAFGSILLVFAESMNGKGIFGLVLALCCMVLTASFLTLNRVWKKHTPDGEANCFMPHVIAGLAVCLVSAACGADPAQVHGVDWLWLCLQGVLVMPIAFVLITRATNYLPSSEVGLFFLIETVFGPVWVKLAGYESPPPLTTYGGIILVLTLAAHSFLSIWEYRRLATESAATPVTKPVL